MGRKSTTGGVRPHGERILFDFIYQGQRCRPTLDLPPTPANLKYARRLADEIRDKIRHGTFSIEHYFPDFTSPLRLGITRKPARTVGEYIDAWLASCTSLSASTQNGYRKASGHWRTWFGEQPIDRVRHSDVTTKMGAHPWGSNKTRNNVLSIGKQIFAMAERDGALKLNPMEGIEFLDVQTDEPDPLAREEIEIMLGGLAKRGPEIADYYEFAFFTGLRPSEQIELKWEKIDWRAGTMRIEAARVRGLPAPGTDTAARNQDGRQAFTASVSQRTTKTHTARDVLLNERAMAVLQRQKARTLLAGEHVFRNPHTGSPWADENKQGKHWRTAMRAAGLRARMPYQARHTYATLLLMSGANPAWAAKQLGHSVQMFFKKYARWIGDTEQNQRELGKLESFLAVPVPNPVPNRRT